MLRLYLFGAPRIERDGVDLAPRRSKALALLAYLVVTGRAHGREGLVAMLWPEFEPDDGRNNLRRELSLLRAALGDTALVADRRQVAWGDPASTWVDVTAFREAVAAARAHGHADGLCAACAGALAGAVELAGAELLDGLSLADSPAFEEWLFFAREELRQQLAWALELLVWWHGGRGELQAGLSAARRWQALDPLNEAPRRALMELYARAGQPAAALRQYEEGARLLMAELGAEPEPATTALYQAIRAREIAAAPRGPRPRPAPPLPAAAEELWPPQTSFIGRRREIGDVVARLADPACRLLSLVGPGGIGKTRLAAEVAEHCRGAFADGAAVVRLVGVAAPDHIPGAVADALGLNLTGAGPAWDELAAMLRGREQLLVLDNLEQLLDATPRIATLLRDAPRLKLLATTREALGLQEEWLWPLAGLAVPPDEPGAAPEDSDAVRLFLARARQRRGDGEPAREREAVARICRLLGGMPLAIELAAAWSATLSCAEIADEVAAGQALLETGLRNVPERHRSVQAIFDQTWSRLDPRLQGALARLSVFPAGCTREAAAVVAGAGLAELAGLGERALLYREADGRYRLHPLVRQGAARRLAEQPEEEASALAAGGRYYGHLLADQFARYMGGEQVAAIATMIAERENIRAALPHVLDQLTGEPLLRALLALQDCYFSCGPYQEGVELLSLAERRLRARDEPEARLVLAEVLNCLGFFAIRLGDTAQARALLDESLALFTALGATPLDGDGTDPEIGLGILALIAGDYRAASRYGERVRARSAAAGLTANHAYGWYLRAEAAYAQGLLAAADEAARRALALTETIGAEWFGAYIRAQLGQIAVSLGRYDEAEAHFGASHRIRETFGDREGMALALLGLGDAATRRGDVPLAAERYAVSLDHYTQVGDRGGMARALLGMAGVARATGDHPGAWARLRAALAHARDLSYRHVALDGVVHAAAALMAAGRPAEAPALLVVALVHPAGRDDSVRWAQELLGQCEGLLPPELFAAAAARGRETSLEAMVDWVLAAPGPEA